MFTNVHYNFESFQAFMEKPQTDNYAHEKLQLHQNGLVQTIGFAPQMKEQ